MKRILVSVFTLSLSILSFGQEDYDLIFDDGVKNTKIAIGTDLVTLCTGTVNFNASYNLSDKFQVKVGVGATPFGFIFDATSLLSDEPPIMQRDLKTGSFLSGGIKYFLNKEHGLINSGAGAYYALYLERWKNLDALDNSFFYKRTKLNIVGGTNVGLFGNFNLDIEYGMSVGFYTTGIVLLPTSESSDLIYGLNLGLGLNYKL